MTNNMSIQIQLNKYKWYARGGVYVCGYCFDKQGNLLLESSLCDYFSDTHCAAELKKRLLEANGLFSVVIHTPDCLIAATDRIRRFPLFYTSQGIITDDPLSFPSSGEWDVLSKAFYIASGAVLPGHTLLQDIQQLPPASCAELISSSWEVSSYASFLSSFPQEKDVSLDELDVVMNSVFQRLVTSAKKRQLIVPLTAGNDSRLILCMLHKMGYNNVICYTVEGKDGDEWEGAHQTALRLGYTHYRVDMQDETIQQLCYANPDEFERYYRYVGAYTNFCWLYDYVAIRYLEKLHIIAKDAIFVPGHSGDMIAGSHITKSKMRMHMSVRSMARRMLYVGFEYRKSRLVYNELVRYFEIAKREGYTDYSAYQNWIVQHRQAHNIVHSTRVYDFCGYEVRLPLWDNELYDLFSHLPYASLMNGRLYTQYVKHVFSLFSLPTKEYTSSWCWFAVAVRSFVKYNMPKSLLRYIHKIKDPIGEGLLSQPLGEDLSRWLGHPHACTNSNELLLQWYLMQVYRYFHSRSF